MDTQCKDNDPTDLVDGVDNPACSESQQRDRKEDCAPEPSTGLTLT